MTITIPETLRAGEDLDVFLADLKETISSNGDVLLDFKNTKKIDSSGLGILIRALSHARVNSSELRLTNLNDSIASLFLITKLEQVFEII